MTRRLLVTGTDTGVGKTFVSAGLCAWLRARGEDVLGFKPVESGTNENDGVPGDAELLARCCGTGLQACNVYALAEPLAPMVAARREGATIEVARLDSAFERASAASDFLIVEGVGGALVEVADGLPVADLAVRWNLPALVVAANRLGVLSHTLLTVEALQSRGVSVLGVVLNTVSEGPPGLAERTNQEELERLLPPEVPLLPTCSFVAAEERGRPASLAQGVAELAGQLFPSS